MSSHVNDYASWDEKNVIPSPGLVFLQNKLLQKSAYEHTYEHPEGVSATLNLSWIIGGAIIIK